VRLGETAVAGAILTFLGGKQPFPASQSVFLTIDLESGVEYTGPIPLELLKTDQDRIGVAEQAAKDELQATEATSRAGKMCFDRHPARRQLPCRISQGPTVRAPTLQRRLARGRPYQGSQDRPSGVLRGL